MAYGVERRRQSAGIDISKPALAGQQRRQPGVERFIRKVGDAGIELAGEGGAEAKAGRGLAPRQQGQTVRARALEQGRLDRGGVGAAVLAAG